MYKRERERQKRDTRGLDLDLTSERLRSGFEGLPFAALASSESLCSGWHGAKLMWCIGGGLGLFTPYLCSCLALIRQIRDFWFFLLECQ